jgi:hypothetical protein
VNISELDQLVRDELDRVESAKDFGVALWRQELDENGANWDAHIKRLRGNGSSDGTWRNVVPNCARRSISTTKTSDAAHSAACPAQPLR